MIVVHRRDGQSSGKESGGDEEARLGTKAVRSSIQHGIQAKNKKRRPKRIVELDPRQPHPSFTSSDWPVTSSDLPVTSHDSSPPKHLHQRSISHSISLNSNPNRISKSKYSTERIGRSNRSRDLNPETFDQPVVQEDFRKRVENLRNEVGENWLRVWSESSESELRSVKT